MTPTDALMLLAKATMRPFGKEDWSAFAGCESTHPVIGEYGTAVLVVDNDCLLVIVPENAETGGELFNLGIEGDTRERVRDALVKSGYGVAELGLISASYRGMNSTGSEIHAIVYKDDGYADTGTVYIDRDGKGEW